MNDVAIEQDERDAAARQFLSGDAETMYAYDDTIYTGNWRILTDAEADDAAADYIRESVWAFNAWFVADYLPEGVGTEVVEALQPQCEGANDTILSMIGDRFDEFAQAAIGADGRGHFLASWDGCEHEFQHDGRTWYGYRS